MDWHARLKSVPIGECPRCGDTLYQTARADTVECLRCGLNPQPMNRDRSPNGAAPTLTLRLLGGIQHWLMMLDAKGGRQSRLWARLERAEAYLIERFNREDTAEEAEAFAVIWPPVEYGGEA